MRKSYTGVWTNWGSKDSVFDAILDIALFAWLLDETAVHETYGGGRIGNGSPPTACSPSSRAARTADGSCNDLGGNPLMGAVGTRFGRNVPNGAAYPDESSLLDPNPRLVSAKLLRRRDAEVPAGIINVLSVAWIQFMTHDWFSHGPNTAAGGMIEVPLPADDPLRPELESLFVMRTQPDTTRVASEGDIAPTFLNTVTHWWDGSQLYGSDAETQNSLRSGVDGKLLLEGDGRLLPDLAGDGRSDAGFDRNWWVGLELLHTVFALEHNAVCDMLKRNYPDWNDQKLFDTARLVTAALMAKIHTVEWTPAILPNPHLEVALNKNWHGIRDQLQSRLPDSVLNFGLKIVPLSDSLVGNPRDLRGHPYQITEEFVSVYRFHSLLPEQLDLKNSTGDVTKVPTGETRDANARSLVKEHGVEAWLHSFGIQSAAAHVLHNYPKFLQDLDTPHGTIDMGTIDILRDRERGVPRYNEFRRHLALKPIESFLDLTAGNRELADEIAAVYKNDVELLDLQVGMQAEGVRPDCFGFGETAFQVFIMIASYRLMKDRFYTDDYRAEIYTQQGLDWVESNDMRGVLLRHFPALEETELADHGNAFAPW
jgi:hypothetical protein